MAVIRRVASPVGAFNVALPATLIDDSPAYILDGLCQVNCHTTAIFPSSTAYTCTLTAHATANTWSAWAEIADSNSATLSALAASVDMHIAAVVVEEGSIADKLFIVEISYGASKTVVYRCRLLTETNKLPTVQSPRARGIRIPAGETIYARVMSNQATSPTLSVHIRHFPHT